jgi:hypothetical protein
VAGQSLRAEFGIPVFAAICVTARYGRIGWERYWKIGQISAIR